MQSLVTAVWRSVWYSTDTGMCLFDSLYGLLPEPSLLSGGYHELLSRATAARAWRLPCLYLVMSLLKLEGWCPCRLTSSRCGAEAEGKLGFSKMFLYWECLVHITEKHIEQISLIDTWTGCMKLKIRSIEFISVMCNICWYENVLSFGRRSWDYHDRSRCERRVFQVDPSLIYRDSCMLYEYRTQLRIWGHKEFVWMWGSDQLSIKFWRRVTAEVSDCWLCLSPKLKVC